MKRVMFLLWCVLIPYADASPGILQVYCRVLEYETGAILDPQRHEARFFPDMDAVPASVRKHTQETEYTVIDLRSMPESRLRKLLRKVENVPQSFRDCNSRFILLRADVDLEEPVVVEIIADYPYFFGKSRQERLLLARILPEDAVDRRIPRSWDGGLPYEENISVKPRKGSRIALHERPNGAVLDYVEKEFFTERLRTDGDWMLVRSHLGRVYIHLEKNRVAIEN
jgi:hypothetical protein